MLLIRLGAASHPSCLLHPRKARIRHEAFRYGPGDGVFPLRLARKNTGVGAWVQILTLPPPCCVASPLPVSVSSSVKRGSHSGLVGAVARIMLGTHKCSGNRRCWPYYGISSRVNHCFSLQTLDNTLFIHGKWI